MQKILRTPEAAKYCGLAASTLEKMRIRGDGPEHVVLTARAIGYQIDKLDRWIESRCRQSTSEVRI